MQNLRKHLIKNKIHLKAEECIVFESLKASSPVVLNASTPADIAKETEPSMDEETLSEASST